MFASLVLAYLLTSGSWAFDGYTAVVDLLNHRWSETCSSTIKGGNVNLHTRLTNVIGSCQPKIEVVHLPPNYRPNWVLNANCADDCFRTKCGGSPLFSCQEVLERVKVKDAFHKTQDLTISAGCVCAKIPNTLSEFKPPMVF